MTRLNNGSKLIITGMNSETKNQLIIFLYNQAIMHFTERIENNTRNICFAALLQVAPLKSVPIGPRCL